MDNNRPQPEIETDWFNYLVVVLKNKEFIIKATLAGAFLAAAVSLFIPPTYLAETRILPPQTASSSMAAAFASQMGGMGASVLGVKTTNDLYMELLKTRSVADYVVYKLDLMKAYKIESKESMRSKLGAGLVVGNDKRSGLITIGYMHRSPQLAADIANAYVEGLQNLNNKLAVTEAAARRLFFEEQLKGAKENLIRSEEALKSFQQRTGTIKIDDEAKVVIETVAKMRAMVSVKEVELRVMKSYATAQNPDMQRVQNESAALKEELLKMESKNRAGDDYMPTVGKMSALGTEYIRKMREFKFHEALYEILMKQFEGAKLDESKDAALVQVVENAIAPEMRIKPQRRKMVVNTFFLTLFLTTAFVVFKGYCQSLIADTETKEKIRQTKGYLDFSQLIKDLKLEKIYENFKGTNRTA